MQAALNRRWSPEGSRFRALERKAAAAPGTLFFIRPVYQDGTDRPGGFEARVQDGENPGQAGRPHCRVRAVIADGQGAKRGLPIHAAAHRRDLGA